LDDRKKNKENITERLRTGVLPPVRRKIGKKTYVPRTKEFEDLEDMKGTLKDTAGNTAELLRFFFLGEGLMGFIGISMIMCSEQGK
jgi:hypothetical protein